MLDTIPGLTTPEVARRIGCSDRTLARWRDAGKGPKFRIYGRAIRYSAEDIARWLREGDRT